MLVEDHFIINVAKRVKADSERFGPYHQHHMAIELRAGAASTRGEALEKFAEVCDKYPEPEYRCSLMQVVCRGVPLAESSPSVAVV
jgi:hypothetical protein